MLGFITERCREYIGIAARRSGASVTQTPKQKAIALQNEPCSQ